MAEPAGAAALSSAAPMSATPVALARPGTRVLLVGTGRHPDGSALPAIPQVRPSIEALAAALRERAGVPAENLRVLADPASPLEFGSAVARAAAEATDVLLVHYAGHGLIGLARAFADRQVVVGPMSEDELRTVIEAPARAVGQGLEDGLPETMLHEASVHRGSAPTAVLPLLSHALLQTWQRSGTVLTLAAYRSTGGIDGAVASTAEQAYASLAPDAQSAMRAVLLRMVSLGDGTEDTRRRLRSPTSPALTRQAPRPAGRLTP